MQALLSSLDWSKPISNNYNEINNDVSTTTTTTTPTTTPSSILTPLRQLLSTGAGMPQHANVTKIYGHVVDGVHLGSVFGLDELARQCNVRLVLRMNAGRDEAPYRIARRPFLTEELGPVIVFRGGRGGERGGGSGAQKEESKLSTTTTTTPSENSVNDDDAADSSKPHVSNTTTKKNNNNNQNKNKNISTVTREEFYQQLNDTLQKEGCDDPPRYDHEWRMSPIFVRSVFAIDEPGFDMYPHFEELTGLMELVLQKGRRGQFEATGGAIPKDRVTEFLAQELEKNRDVNKSGNDNDDHADDDGEGENKKNETKASPVTTTKPRRSFNFGTQPGVFESNLFLPSVACHCVQGVSRSASIIVAYLLKKCWMMMMMMSNRNDPVIAQTATSSFSIVQNFVKEMKSKRSVIEPNSGFMKQLYKWQDTLFLPLMSTPEEFGREFQHRIRILQNKTISLDKSTAMDSSVSSSANDGGKNEGEETKAIHGQVLKNILSSLIQTHPNQHKSQNLDFESLLIENKSISFDFIDLMMQVFDEEILQNEIDVDIPYALIVWGDLIEKHFRRNNFDENAQDDFFRKLIYEKILDFSNKNDDQETDDNNYVDKEQQFSRALKLCRLNKKLVSSSTRQKNRSFPCLTSFSFLPIVVSNNCEFWKEFASFVMIQGNNKNEFFEDPLCMKANATMLILYFLKNPLVLTQYQRLKNDDNNNRQEGDVKKSHFSFFNQQMCDAKMDVERARKSDDINKNNINTNDANHEHSDIEVDFFVELLIMLSNEQHQKISDVEQLVEASEAEYCSSEESKNLVHHKILGAIVAFILVCKRGAEDDDNADGFWKRLTMMVQKGDGRFFAIFILESKD